MNGIVPTGCRMARRRSRRPGEGTTWSLENTWGWAPGSRCCWRCSPSAGSSYFATPAKARTAGRLLQVAAGRAAAGAIGHRGVHDRRVHAVAATAPACRPWSFVVDDSASMGIVDRYDDEKLAAESGRRIGSGRAGQRHAARTWPRACCLDDDADLLLGHRPATTGCKLYFVSSAARAQRVDLSELREAVAQARAARREQPAGRGLAERAERPARHAAGGHHPAHRRHQHRRRDAGDAARYARRKGVPLFTVGLGSEQPVRDLELADLLVDEVVFVDDVVNFEFKLTGAASPARRSRSCCAKRTSPRCWRA